MSIWKETGFFLILFLAGLAADARRRATRPRASTAPAPGSGSGYITLPLLKPITAVCCDHGGHPRLPVLQPAGGAHRRRVRHRGGQPVRLQDRLRERPDGPGLRRRRADVRAPARRHAGAAAGASGGRTHERSSAAASSAGRARRSAGSSFAAVLAYAVLSAFKAAGRGAGACRCSWLPEPSSQLGATSRSRSETAVRPLLPQQHRRRGLGHRCSTSSPARWPATASPSSATAGRNAAFIMVLATLMVPLEVHLRAAVHAGLRPRLGEQLRRR